MIKLRINGQEHYVKADASTPLLWVLRDELGLRGTKYGCGVGICGTCTVLIEGEANHACMVPIGSAKGGEIVTIEGLATQGHRLLQVWTAEQVPQCGYCQPGQIVAAAALLRENPKPDELQVAEAMTGVLCRCGTYQRIRQAVRQAASGGVASPSSAPPSSLGPAPDAGVAMNPWLRVHGDGTVTVVVNHSEMGQGVVTSLAMLIAEELEVDLAKVRTEFAPVAEQYVNPRFGIQLTGGSTAVRGEWEQLRTAGASARLMLLRAAARKWRVKATDCRVELGKVSHPASGRVLGYGELAPLAVNGRPPRRVNLRPRQDWRLLGRPVPRLEIPDMVAGRTVYGLDLVLPGMLVASVERPAVFGAGAKRIETGPALALPGVRAVHEVKGGIAVVADNAFGALRGREALHVEWEAGPHADLDGTSLYAELQQGLKKAGKVACRRGSVKNALAAAHRRVEAQYHTSYLAHATMEPLNCIAHVREAACDIWVGTQSQTDTRAVAADITGIPKERVAVHTQFMGGAFGRRLETDVVADAVQLSQRMRQPVQVFCTRRDDLRHDFYRPAHSTAVTAALDSEGRPTAWRHRVAGPALALDMVDVPYHVPNFREEHVQVDTVVPTGAWRAVGAGQNAFAVESFIDELAYAAAADPVAYRHSLLGHSPRHRRVLELAAEQAGWGRTLPMNHGLGVAVYRSFGTWVAQVAEVIVVGGRIRVPRVVCAVDCGTVVNPDTVRAQMEGAVAFGLSAALHEEVRIEHGQVQQANLQDYPILRYDEMPQVDIHIVGSDQPPGGVGEPGVPPIAPAVANGVYAVTGVRLRKLPLRVE